MLPRPALWEPLFGGARLPEQLYDFDGGAGLFSPNIRLRRYARRAGVYRVKKVKGIVRPIHASISRAKPREERHGRPTARHALRSSVVLEFSNATTFVNIVRPFRSLAPLPQKTLPQALGTNKPCQRATLSRTRTTTSTRTMCEAPPLSGCATTGNRAIEYQ